MYRRTCSLFIFILYILQYSICFCLFEQVIFVFYVRNILTTVWIIDIFKIYIHIYFRYKSTYILVCGLMARRTRTSPNPVFALLYDHVLHVVSGIFTDILPMLHLTKCFK